ncbi:MAG: hypothetical protein DHS20C16_27800 [Phycisphaerae bacterium]|nr:MAG: hypothetical protein DHS20C16_27800 [Phycisphaerae bacterium]
MAGPQRCVAVSLLAMVLIASGCANRASLHFVDLNFKRLDSENALTVEVVPDSCAWSIEGDQIRIALASGSVDAESGDRMMMSFVLDGIPWGNEREYRVERRALRCFWHHDRKHERFASLNGVVSVKLLPGEKLTGRFKIMARKQVFHVLTNWTTVGQTLLMGSFTAHRDAETVSSILVRTEKGGMDRTQKGNTIKGGIRRPRRVVGPDVN